MNSSHRSNLQYQGHSPALKTKGRASLLKRKRAMNAREDINEEYDSYLGRVQQFCPGEDPLDFEAFKEAYKRWDNEYDAAVQDGDIAWINELERLLCV